jgi:uncharacterized membrane protein YkoI
MSQFLRHCVLAAISAAVAIGATVTISCSEEASPRDDHNVARAALERREILPLTTILARLRETMRGEVVGVELRRDSGRWVYAIKLIVDDNRLIETRVDARTATILTKAP